MKLELRQAAHWCGGELQGAGSESGGAERVAAGYSIDSRTIAPGELFIAIKGERFDGHDFLADAFSRGAVGAIVARDKLASARKKSGAKSLLVVDDTLKALQRLASTARRHWGKRVIGITGSAGKTTTKEAVAKVLSAKYSVLKSQGNLNNGFGLPLQLLKLEPEHQVAVIEMGMSNAGEIAALAHIAAPDWGVVTNVGTAHAQNFADGVAGIARAKYELVEALPAHGVAFLNCDDHYVSQFGRDFRGKAVYFGCGPCADPRAASIEPLGAEGQRVEVRAGEQQAEMRLKLLGRHNVANAMAAIAVGLQAGVPLKACCAALAELEPEDKRGQVLTIGGATVINDCYNSNPEALKAMIGTLAAMPVGKGGRRILLAGAMLELGAEAAALHAACGQAAAKAGIDAVIGVSGDARALAEAARNAGAEALFFETPEQAGEWLRTAAKPGDVVLLKASRGVRLERALDAWRAS
ncbi:MAG TPA: UDP-N-acetylmuramoyl-tripeptide--D-alanyl-D-alanine ligase [Acidobacteriaceae bacterium]|nr:UDP-N-acetylmuramoyl-tripeptide--D-alanyl-D-alanine ligase [Acidobacteriaceae bacterium]